MSQPRLQHVQCLSPQGLHRMAYWEWGDAANPRVLVCVHGLSRQGRDFDHLARALCDRFRVVCPDVVGRGQSDWLCDPSGYQVPQYVADMVTLLARLDASEVNWVGTSMGGLIGIGLASLPGSPVQRLVLNDVGPTIEPVSIQRISSYLGLPKVYASLEDAATYLRSISLGFGPLTDEEWLGLTRPQIKPAPDGNGFVGHYDPAIAVPVKATTPEIARMSEAMLWQRYDAIRCPTFVLRGAESDLLSRETARAMTERGPRAQVVEVPGVGHAPMLVDADQIDIVRGFLGA